MPSEHDRTIAISSGSVSGADVRRNRWEPPTVEVICLACEISAYAPDGDLPLF
jgi:hypothetical protein